MDRKRIAKELLKIAKDLVGQEDDPMAKETVPKLYMKFYTWLTKTVTKLPASAPVAVQMMKGLENVRKKLKGKQGLKGRVAVEAIANAMRRDFTLDAQPLLSLSRKYGQRTISEIFRG